MWLGQSRVHKQNCASHRSKGYFILLGYQIHLLDWYLSHEKIWEPTKLQKMWSSTRTGWGIFKRKSEQGQKTGRSTRSHSKTCPTPELTQSWHLHSGLHFIHQLFTYNEQYESHMRWYWHFTHHWSGIDILQKRDDKGLGKYCSKAIHHYPPSKV